MCGYKVTAAQLKALEAHRFKKLSVCFCVQDPFLSAVSSLESLSRTLFHFVVGA